jgi:hypothetical protein
VLEVLGWHVGLCHVLHCRILLCFPAHAPITERLAGFGVDIKTKLSIEFAGVSDDGSWPITGATNRRHGRTAYCGVAVVSDAIRATPMPMAAAAFERLRQTDNGVRRCNSQCFRIVTNSKRA